MRRFCHYLRLALIGALAAALGVGLAACGRKGPLDPPPAAAVDQTTVSGQPVMGSDNVPRAPRGPNKRIPLDNLLN